MGVNDENGSWNQETRNLKNYMREKRRTRECGGGREKSIDYFFRGEC